MTVRMQVGIKGDAPYLAALREAAKRGDDVTVLMDVIGVELVSSTIGRFDTSLAPDGTPWKRRYVPQGEQDSSRPILVKAGHLKASITHEASSNQMTVGTNVAYAGVHQFGMTIHAKTSRGLRFKIGNRWITAKSVTIPARPFIGISDDDGEMIQEHARDWMAGPFVGGGLA